MIFANTLSESKHTISNYIYDGDTLVHLLRRRIQAGGFIQGKKGFALYLDGRSCESLNFSYSLKWFCFPQHRSKLTFQSSPSSLKHRISFVSLRFIRSKETKTQRVFSGLITPSVSNFMLAFLTVNLSSNFQQFDFKSVGL